MNDNEAQALLEKAQAPRVTAKRIEEVIVGTVFTRLTETLTVCVLQLANGFTVTGESACASPENYSQVLGEFYAHENAKRKIWALEGYLLKQRLYEAE